METMNDNFVIENGILISCEGEEFTKIPDGVRAINKDAIRSYLEVKELYLPATINNVNWEFLKHCGKLNKIILPSKLFNYNFKLDASNLHEIVIYGEEKELDLSNIDWDSLQRFKNSFILRIENEVTYIKFGDEKFKRDSYSKEIILPHIYINNYSENVVIDASEKWDRGTFIYRAPKANMSETIDNSVELTLAPREMSYNDKRWECPIKINVSAVTYLHPVELECYETERHQGCKLLLLGNRIEEIPLERLDRETYPYVIVWEDYDTVYGKLKAKGWTL